MALARLNGERSLLAIDEPELHLHPHLLGGVLTLLRSIGAPVVIATHADRVLEMLDDPVDAVRVLDPGGLGRTRVAMPCQLDVSRLRRL